MSVENTSIQGITLYSHADDFRSHWIRFLLAEKQIKYQLIVTDHEDEDLASLNPYNQLPMLVEQNLKLFSAPIIAEYLDDRYRQNKLYADAPMARAEQRQYIWRLENDWFKLADHMLRHADTLNIEQKQKAQKELRDTLISLTPLFQHFPYFMSENFSILDCMLAPIFVRLNSMGIDLPKQQCRPIFLYCKRIFSRPSFVKSMTLQEKTRYNELLNME
ncbi:glutathione S-transferase N-terminal domain-containing protein [Acinetobacter baumannii]|uniref:glutathione S-transferase N-terminal domain-containing protein n=1 Tax=Acinetobacter baumannii TaxID=470 RepID=UPI002448DDCD|nr:glutathione S-transferase N-terminal domain-containing protein [Acinetobacter baumannii]MDH2507382.1 glutathione S-transferase N-terminal domain-containing protein [Acinetobacter baumannii]MDX7885610.1 glutathione S-transferase N-terminal domain-containing protein [Acinetobacter baumannii]WOE35555.1 glutathione S-transferase N-terminal domain-containing protein [Acinetobacter baumannii]